MANVVPLQRRRDEVRRKHARVAALVDEHIHTNRAQAAELRRWANEDDLYDEHRQAALDMAERLERNADMLARSRRRVSAEDRAHVSRLLPIIVATLGGRTFTARSLLDIMASNRGAGLRLALNGMSAKSLGRLLQRCADIEVGEYRLACSGHHRHVRAWHVERVE